MKNVLNNGGHYTALLFGGTGLIGKELMKRLFEDWHYNELKVFVRKKMVIKHLHVDMLQIDFDALDDATALINGDDCFCALGTTMRKAGSREAFRKVDYEYVLNIARIAQQNGVKRFVVVSSIGADPASSNFYLKTKGEMEQALQKLSFEQLIIVRPSILMGKRSEFRFGERVGILFARILSPFMIGPIKKYRPIKARTVARAMIKLANSTPTKTIYQSHELKELAK